MFEVVCVDGCVSWPCRVLTLAYGGWSRWRLVWKFAQSWLPLVLSHTRPDHLHPRTSCSVNKTNTFRRRLAATVHYHSHILYTALGRQRDVLPIPFLSFPSLESMTTPQLASSYPILSYPNLSIPAAKLRLSPHLLQLELGAATLAPCHLTPHPATSLCPPPYFDSTFPCRRIAVGLTTAN